MRSFGWALASIFVAMAAPVSAATVMVDLFGTIESFDYDAYTTLTVSPGDKIQFTIVYDDTRTEFVATEGNPGLISTTATLLANGAQETFYDGDVSGGSGFNAISTYRDWDFLGFYGIPNGTFDSTVMAAADFATALISGPPTSWVFEHYYRPTYGTLSPTNSFGTCMGSCGVIGTIQSASIRIPDVTAVPIPASLPVLLAGLGGLALAGRRQRRLASLR